MAELEDVLNSRTLTEQSRETYRRNYRKLFNILQQPIRNAPQEQIFYAVEEIANDNINNKLTYINIPILIKQFYNEPVDKLMEVREQLFTQRENNLKNVNVKDTDLPKYEDVKKYVNGLFGVNNVKFIVNYLIFNYGVRNKDVNVFITTRKLTKDTDTDTNYFLVKEREIEWVRNDYKTITSHLQQRIIIKSKTLIDAVKTLPLNTWLLSGTSQPIAETSLNNIVSRMLYLYKDKHLTEGQYFKINVAYLQTQPNSYSKIITMGEIRGTNADTIEKYYNISKPISKA